jgi:hypothetical protein
LRSCWREDRTPEKLDGGLEVEMAKWSGDPGARVCPLCGHDETVSRGKVAPSIWEYTCSVHPKWIFIADGTASPLPEWSGVMGELGLYEDLPKCVYEGEPFVEYGVVEYRYRTQFPDAWDKVRERYPYRAEGEHAEYTTSSFLAAALARLQREGVLVKKFGKATGCWSYNGEVSYWATPPAKTDNDLSWEQFASEHGVGDTPPA